MAPLIVEQEVNYITSNYITNNYMGNYITGSPPDRGAGSEERAPSAVQPRACGGQAQVCVHAADASVRYWPQDAGVLLIN